MNVKINHKPSGVPEATVACSSGTASFSEQPVVVAHITSYDSHGVGTVVGRLAMSRGEAYELGIALLNQSRL